MEHTPDTARFDRIEAAHEFLTGIVAGIAVTQRKIGESQLRTEFALTQVGQQMHKLAEAQTKQAEAHTILAEAQARTAEHIDILTVKSAETQGKLDALIDMWDRSIRERGGINGPPQPPPAA